jgi:hypothetical protein
MADTSTQVAIAFKWFFIQPLSKSHHQRGSRNIFLKDSGTHG